MTSVSTITRLVSSECRRWPTTSNNGAANIGKTTVSEIIAATRDGKTLIYTDSPGEQIGFVDITNPANPIPTGVLAMGGEPTSVDVLGNNYALVAVNTSETSSILVAS